MRSLSRRLLIGTGAGTGIVLFAAGITLYALVRASLLSEFDKALLERAATLSALVEQSGDEIMLEFTEDEMADLRRAERSEYFQVWREDGTVVGKSPLLGVEDLPREHSLANKPVIGSLELPGKTPGRMAALQFTPRLDDEAPEPSNHERLTLAVARDITDVTSSLGQLRALLMAVGLVATLASLGLLAWLVRMGLKPVNQLANKINLIDEERLSARIDPAESPRELSAIVIRLNEMLGRLDAAFVREKTMTANVAHELRTPLAGIRSTLEVALSRERDATASRQVMSECLQICTQTQRLMENLLAMARLEAGSESMKRERTEVGALLRRAWKPFDELARERNLNVRWDMTPDLHLETDPDKLGIVFANVLENAARYADQGGTVTIDGSRSNGRLHIRVSNTGSSLSDEDVARVFDRFWRGERSRAATGVHYGLGLSLCRTILQRLGGAIQAESTQEGRFVISVTV